jgi:predicted metal-dependent enzyme (double-stranded beta helix superfamily)
MLDVDQFVAECQASLLETEPRLAVADLLERTLDDSSSVEQALPAARAELTTLHHSPELTVLKVVWAPGMSIWPHDHQMWAAIGIYAGQEDNTFYRRHPDQPTSVASTGGKELREGDVLLLGKDAIHGVTNPLDRITAAIHVYGGDFLNQPRSQWGPGPLEERPYDFDVVRGQFAEANTRAGLPR